MGKSPCREKNGLKKGPWTAEEDQKLIDYIQKHGHGKWRTVPKNAGLKRCGKSCRLRWINYLRPDIKRGKFSFEEEETIIQLHSVLGNRWSTIAARLPGRTDNEIKNYWNTHIKKRLLRVGIDPVTHSPRLDLLELSSMLNSISHYNSSELDVSSFLGGPVLNPDLLSLAAFLFCQRKTPDIISQNLPGNQFGYPQVQNQLQSPIQEIQSFTTTRASSSAPLLDESQLMQMQAKVEQFSPNITNFSCQNSLPILWQQNGEAPNFSESFIPIPNCDYQEYSNQSIINPLSDNQMFFSNKSDNIPNFSFSSVLPTSSSTPTPLNSLSTTYVNSSTDEERDSYCSNVFMFDIPNSLDVDGLACASNL